ncbi:hypothetical protein ABB37_08581 [Leptomonas pyrrhocoris]|uniref:Uncharacterized protein n=1 Tax=Leptomonas pyrrhocoris TaxID=157538 RepID=A0A0M9FSN6_LEPPY|nr:hypothetical protein ABB37_08581 [Leptomonas pyrrhocoris]KPA75280.1 hypothetical protein ABB37_08581 [Leptomonas pyrrhocoris]|eukprot:XP_015653719.1 hypothetical protein ABB37_08581 [Leptomonas pyrrhocoris]
MFDVYAITTFHGGCTCAPLFPFFLSFTHTHTQTLSLARCVRRSSSSFCLLYPFPQLLLLSLIFLLVLLQGGCSTAYSLAVILCMLPFCKGVDRTVLFYRPFFYWALQLRQRRFLLLFICFVVEGPHLSFAVLLREIDTCIHIYIYMICLFHAVKKQVGRRRRRSVFVFGRVLNAFFSFYLVSLLLPFFFVCVCVCFVL